MRHALVLVLVLLVQPAWAIVPIIGTENLPLWYDIPENVTVYVAGRKADCLEFTWDVANDAVLINEAPFITGPKYVPPADEIVKIHSNNPYMVHCTTELGMSWKEAYVAYRKKDRALSRYMGKKAQEFYAGEITYEEFLWYANRHLRENDYDLIIDTEYGYRLNGTLIGSKSYGRETPIYIAKLSPAQRGEKFPPINAEKVIEGRVKLLFRNPEIPRIVTITGNGNLRIVGGVAEVASAQAQIEESRNLGRLITGPISQQALAEIVGIESGGRR